MRIHFIAIGGAAMHSLAITLKQKGHEVTGSDDEVFDPAKTQLAMVGLLPAEYGWFPDKITQNLDVVILGMHAQKDNPELQRALELGVRVYSYPEFLFRETADKTRVVIAGSHGKTTITAMVMHVLKYRGYQFDYMVGSRLEGFENMVDLSKDNKIAIFEGDEYLSSCLDPRPKFHLYQPQLALVSGIAWDHINVFPTWDEYVKQFSIFIENMPSGGCLVYCEEDAALKNIAEAVNPKVLKEAYATPKYSIEQGVSCIHYENTLYPLGVFGRHNMQNIEGARLICKHLGITGKQFFDAISHFKGAGKRLQLLGQKGNTTVFLDFAHSPSKVEATVNAAKEQFPGRKLVACLELHTYSSLSKKFLDHYRNTLDNADEAVVFYNPQTILHKRLEMISREDVMTAFNKQGLKVFTTKNEQESYLHYKHWENAVLLLMSSGNFSGIDFKGLTEELLKGINE
jgi:UDP-N-acetylmuramate: L-alanyl-gamma-D-glutamyl-meso-diaminopimelate ligase